MNAVSCDQLSPSSSSDEDSETSATAKVVTRREMIMALIARSEDQEESETGEANDEVTHHQQAGSAMAPPDMLELEGNGIHAAEERKKWGYYRKFASPIEDLPKDRAAKVRCNLCSKIISKSGIAFHIDGVHNKIRVKCDVCGKEVRKDWLKAHKKTVHSQAKNVLKGKLKEHKMIHANEGRAKKIPCNICGKLVLKRNLKIHKNIVHCHPSLRERVNCDHCGINVFKEKLKEHKMIHSKEGRFKKIPCNICGKLVQERNLKKHLKIHPEVNEGTECIINHEFKGNVKINEKKSNLIIKIISCKICGMRVQKKCLKQHLKEHSRKE